MVGGVGSVVGGEIITYQSHTYSYIRMHVHACIHVYICMCAHTCALAPAVCMYKKSENDRKMINCSWQQFSSQLRCAAASAATALTALLAANSELEHRPHNADDPQACVCVCVCVCVKYIFCSSTTAADCSDINDRYAFTSMRQPTPHPPLPTTSESSLLCTCLELYDNIYVCLQQESMTAGEWEGKHRLGSLICMALSNFCCSFVLESSRQGITRW